MKNMKKLLGAMAALGFSTLGAVNVVACSNTPTKGKQLEETFSDTYKVPFAEEAAAGVQASTTANEFKFTFGADDSTGITQTEIVKEIVAKKDAPVQNGIGKEEKDAVMPTEGITNPTKAGQFAAGVMGTDQDHLKADKQGYVDVKLKLVLWESFADSKQKDTYKWVEQDETMDITLKVATADTTTKVDISTGVSVTDPANISADTTKTFADLNTNSVIGNLVTAAINVKQAKTDAVLGTDFILTNDQTATTKQSATIKVNFTVTANANSTKLDAGKIFHFSITLK